MGRNRDGASLGLEWVSTQMFTNRIRPPNSNPMHDLSKWLSLLLEDLPFAHAPTHTRLSERFTTRVFSTPSCTNCRTSFFIALSSWRFT